MRVPYYMMFLSFNSNTTDVATGTVSAHHSVAHEFIRGGLWYSCYLIFSFLCRVYWSFSIDHCIVCPSIYGFWLYNWFVVIMVFNATFTNVSVISWRSVLLEEETGIFGENHRPVASHWQILSHNVVSSTPRLSGIWTHNVSGDIHWLHM